MNLRTLAFGLLSSATMFSLGCEPISCTEAGCSHGATFRVGGTEGFDGGEWTVDLELDGEHWSSTCYADTLDCEPVVGANDPLSVEVSMSEEGVVWVSFVAADEEDLPANYDLRVSSGDLIGGDGAGTLDYELFRPNGPGCAPVCENVEIEV